MKGSRIWNIRQRQQRQIRQAAAGFQTEFIIASRYTAQNSESRTAPQCFGFSEGFPFPLGQPQSMRFQRMPPSEHFPSPIVLARHPTVGQPCCGKLLNPMFSKALIKAWNLISVRLYFYIVSPYLNADIGCQPLSRAFTDCGPT